ncbi:taste receptor type 2 member 41-like [Varanus komodoensis]|uniref:taste receptor type 2 member 41-like n=1 Tax=Varanus komodoensis TaxID=61221 RepID=UPI001CF7B5B9|nr:taste receptor type 2 member 41-like [Varanus komodoensis]
MDLNHGALEIFACVVMISSSVVGNTLLIFCTWRCINEHLRTSFTLIFSLAFVHLVNNLVVNILKTVYAFGVWLEPVGCKVIVFTTTCTTTLAIWFTLYLALLYCLKLCRVVHPPAEAASRNLRKYHLSLLFALWFAGIAICSPLLLYVQKTGQLNLKNETYQEFSSLIYAECKTEYKNDKIEIFYGKIFLVAVDVLPLLIMLLVGFRIAHLVWQHKKTTYGGIWIGNDATETEVLRACKYILLLILLITSLWISYFTLMYCLKNFKYYYFAPSVLTVLSSGYSAVSPYLLMLINYKVQMRCFCCKDEKIPVSLSASSPFVSPYA